MTNLEPPVLEPMLEPAPSELTIQEVVIGEGAEAPANSTVKVHYLGVDYETGEEFDSSWSRGESIEFPLNRLIKGWQEGIPGMKVGGRRTLICPPEMAYGPSGSGHRLSGRTLVFVIDLLGVK
jgi:peptidylprolyl isomerase